MVVRDRQGHAVGDLKQEDFQVFDNDKPRVISGFTIEKRGVTVVNAVAGRARGASRRPRPLQAAQDYMRSAGYRLPL